MDLFSVCSFAAVILCGMAAAYVIGFRNGWKHAHRTILAEHKHSVMVMKHNYEQSLILMEMQVDNLRHMHDKMSVN